MSSYKENAAGSNDNASQDSLLGFQPSSSGRKDAKLFWLAAVCLILILATGGVIFQQLVGQFNELERQRSAFAHSVAVISNLRAIRARLELAQRSASDYWRAQDQNLVQVYRQSSQELPESYKQLRAIINTEHDRQLLQQLQQLIDAQLQYDNDTISMVANRGTMNDAMTTAMVARLTLGLRKSADATAAFLTSWQQQEVATLTRRDVLTARQLSTARSVAMNSLAVGVALVVTFVGLLLSYLRRRTQIEQQLRLTSEVWKGTLESLSQGVAMYDMKGKLVLWNARFCEISGVPHGRLHVGMSHERVIHASESLRGKDADEALQVVANIIARIHLGEPSLVERQRDDGAVLQVSARPMSRDFYVVTLTDVTDIRRSEQIAKDQATRLAAIMNNVPDAIVTINERGSIESWSEGAQRLFGYTLDEALHGNVSMLLSAAHARHLQPLLEGNEPRLMSGRRELEGRHKAGHSFPIDLSASEIQVGGRRLFVGIIRDITERRMIERLKSEFVATVSHELRTPLTSIAGSLSLLAAGLGGELPPKAQRLITIAHKNSERLTLLINDILDLEKAESGKLDLNLQLHSLAAVVTQSLEANRSYAQQFQVRFVLSLMSSDPIVLIDEARIQQVLANFLSNAAKFSPRGGQVLIKLELLSEARDAMVRVSVHDDGPGVPEAFRARIFTRFAQADASDSRQKGGTGLGLAIVKSLIEQHHGRVGFDSGHSAVGNGQGASFWFELLLVQVPASQSVAQHV
jgi:PAS domain S-box-containing protein